MEVRLEKSGPAMERGILVEWIVSNGELVEAGQTICVIETDKIDLEIASPFRGTLIHAVSKDQEIAVGQVIATIEGR